MKLKKIRVRLKDLHHGKILYVAEPRCGIETIQIVGKPKTVMLGAIFGLKGRPSLFIDTISLDYSKWNTDQVNTRSLSDMGVYNAYGYRRTFHTMKQAQQYVARIKDTAEVKAYWERHLRNWGMIDDYPTDYGN